MSKARARTIGIGLARKVFLLILASFVIVEFTADYFFPLRTNIHNPLALLSSAGAALLATLLISVAWGGHRYDSTFKAKNTFLSGADMDATLDALPDFVSVHDRDFRVVKVNRALCEFLGKEPAEIIGRFCYEIFHERNEPYEHCPHKLSSVLDHPVTEVINDPKIGVPLQITCSPFTENGSFQGSMHTARVAEPVGAGRLPLAKVIPICASCKSIRVPGGEWHSVEDYFLKVHDLQFTHTFCRGCQEKLYPEFTKP